MNKRRLLAITGSIGLLAGLTGVAAAPALGVPTHQHCLMLDNGDSVAIAGGVTSQAPHDPAFHNFHNNVHVSLGLAGPLVITADTTIPYTCPPS